MERPDVIGIAIGLLGVLWGIVQVFARKYADRQENDLAGLSKKHAELYKELIETQRQNSDSSNRLSLSIDRLTQTVSHIEEQTDERYRAINSRMDDTHEALELIRKRLHWVMNKITILKFSLEKSGDRLAGDWDAP